MNDFSFGIYPVITEEFCFPYTSIHVLKEVIKGGAKIVQLREKNCSKKTLYELALKYRQITKKNGVTLIINDNIDIALSVEADGVHLGQDDIPLKVAKKIAPNLIIGVSTHNFSEAKKAEKDGATYINIGPIYQTKTKTLTYKPLGIEILKKIAPNIPFTVMGGIKENHIPELLSLNVKNIAMITEITKAPNISEKVKKLMQYFF